MAVVGSRDILSINCYGVCESGKDVPVEPNTVFPMGSLTKAFTAALIAMQVDDGTVAWDTRVCDILPEFKLHDPWVTKEFRVHDLLTMRTGLPALAGTPALYFGADGDALIEGLEHIEPASSFRLEYAYQNAPYMIAARVLKKITGKSWEQNLAARIVKPLGMRRTGCTKAGFNKSDSGVSPHRDLGGEVAVVPQEHPMLDAPFTLGAAASMYASISDMAAWMMLQLAGGEWNGKRLLSEESIRTLHAPHTFIGAAGDQLAYCMGWKLFQAEPFFFLAHRGSTFGGECMAALIPQADVGICVLTNLGGTLLPEVLVRTFFDEHFQNDGKDWSEELRMRAAGNETSAESLPSPEEPVPALPLDAYTGEYEHPACGVITITVHGGDLSIRFGPKGQALFLKHFDGHVFSLSAEEELDLETLVEFQVAGEGVVNGVEIAQFKEQGVCVFGKRR